jgi:hypothetical protein
MKRNLFFFILCIATFFTLGILITRVSAAPKDLPVDSSKTFYACVPTSPTRNDQAVIPGSIITNSFIATWDMGFNPYQPACFQDPSDTVVFWNGTGKQGIPGPQGNSGISGYQIVQSATLLAKPTQKVSVFCPTGKVVLGGGATLLSSSHDFSLQSSGPASGSHGWSASYTSAHNRQVPIVLWAICATVSH